MLFSQKREGIADVKRIANEGGKDVFWDTPGREGIPQSLSPLLDLALFQLPLLLYFTLEEPGKGFGLTCVQVRPLSLHAV
ncbi:hypothetical protein STEG23_020795 [Scotinomys teguina]